MWYVTLLIVEKKDSIVKKEEIACSKQRFDDHVFIMDGWLADKSEILVIIHISIMSHFEYLEVS
jgi:hypothetical protein